MKRYFPPGQIPNNPDDAYKKALRGISEKELDESIRREFFAQYDSANISGKKLAEIGKAYLEGKKPEKPPRDHRLYTDLKTGNYTEIGWLDMRIDEICRRGQLQPDFP